MRTSTCPRGAAAAVAQTATNRGPQQARLSAVLFAERMGVSRDTLHRLEKGDPAIALGTYLRALRELGLDRDLDSVARDDELGRKLQDLALPAPRRRRSVGVATGELRSSTPGNGEGV